MQQNATNGHTPTEVTPYKNIAFDAYLNWRATQGMIITDTGALDTMTKDMFCDYFDVDRATLWRWSKMPGIEDKINARLEEIAPGNRVRAAWNRLLTLGLTSIGKNSFHGDQRAAVDALKTYLGHFGDLRLPVQRQDIKIQGGLADVLAAADREGILEGEVVEPSPTDAGASDQAPSVLPPTS